MVGVVVDGLGGPGLRGAAEGSDGVGVNIALALGNDALTAGFRHFEHYFGQLHRGKVGHYKPPELYRKQALVFQVAVYLNLLAF